MTDGSSSYSLPLPRAGDAIEDYCRVCKSDREHRIVAIGSAIGSAIGGATDGATDGATGGAIGSAGARPRVICGYCGSQHNYRGGASARSGGPSTDTPHRPKTREAEAWPLVSERERIHTPVMTNDDIDIEMLLRRIIREEAGLTAIAPAEKWRGGELILRPGKSGLQEKTWPIETLFHKVVMVRNRLRTLEQQINSTELPDDVKLKIQGYITGCYGSLTSFNVLFADDADGFSGAKK